ncbi:MAG: DUF3570 domain-containing protein [Labilithrix sp.]|nr:DUF3570 domain-containing protein [Labilithrix sp.]MCW5814111.1 DUF3570 domain-containing protein [Labilithrix sp.]
MRLQLGRLLFACAVTALASLASREASAQVAEVDTAHTLYHEAPTRSNMTVYTPGVAAQATPWEWITIRGGYEADVVSGASVATKAGPAYQSVNAGADVITTASVRDVRHSPNGGLTLRKGDVAYTAAYTYGTENDYRSHNVFVGAKTDAYGHNTQLEISYARNFDSVCNRVQAVNDTAPRFRALEDSSGCFTKNPLRARERLDIDGFQASWTQAWTPVFATQLAYTAQLIEGFQSNPYRSVIVAQGLKAQEHHPEQRARQALALRMNFYVRPIKVAFRLTGRIYRDTWDVTSGTGELEAERYLFESFRVTARGRYYKQSGALFWSDDYTGGDPPLGPKGQYFTGDRELSPFWSLGLGARVAYTIRPAPRFEGGKPRLLGILESAKVGASFDLIQFSYDEYTLAGRPIENARAFIFGLTAGALF